MYRPSRTPLGKSGSRAKEFTGAMSHTHAAVIGGQAPAGTWCAEQAAGGARL
jgi:hypothetical protein